MPAGPWYEKRRRKCTVPIPHPICSNAMTLFCGAHAMACAKTYALILSTHATDSAPSVIRCRMRERAPPPPHVHPSLLQCRHAVALHAPAFKSHGPKLNWAHGRLACGGVRTRVRTRTLSHRGHAKSMDLVCRLSGVVRVRSRVPMGTPLARRSVGASAKWSTSPAPSGQPGDFRPTARPPPSKSVA